MDTSSEQQQQQKTGSKRKHVTLTISNKLKVIEKIEKGVSGKLISQMFGISRQTVSDIKKHTSAIKAYASQFDVTNEKSTVSKRMTLKRSKDDRLETALYAWYMRQRRNDVSVQTSDLLAAAENLKLQIGIPELSCNLGWLTRFRYRHNIKDSDIGIITEVEVLPEQKPFKSDHSSSLHENEESEERDGENEASAMTMIPMEFMIKDEGDTECDYVTSEGNENEDEQVGVGAGGGGTTFRENQNPNSVVDAAREGIDAVINYVGYSSNRRLWSYYEQLRTVREMIVEEQKQMHGNSLQGVEAQFNFPYT